MLRFYQYEGDLIGLSADDNHLVFRWVEIDCKILFSIARLGNGASCHFASDKAGLKKLKQAINEFCNYCFLLFDWCTMILAKVKRESVCRLIEKCGFEKLITSNGYTAYTRCKSWAA